MGYKHAAAGRMPALHVSTSMIGPPCSAEKHHAADIFVCVAYRCGISVRVNACKRSRATNRTSTLSCSSQMARCVRSNTVHAEHGDVRVGAGSSQSVTHFTHSDWMQQLYVFTFSQVVFLLFTTCLGGACNGALVIPTARNLRLYKLCNVQK